MNTLILVELIIHTNAYKHLNSGELSDRGILFEPINSFSAYVTNSHYRRRVETGDVIQLDDIYYACLTNTKTPQILHLKKSMVSAVQFGLVTESHFRFLLGLLRYCTQKKNHPALRAKLERFGGHILAVSLYFGSLCLVHSLAIQNTALAPELVQDMRLQNLVYKQSRAFIASAQKQPDIHQNFATPKRPPIPVEQIKIRVHLKPRKPEKICFDSSADLDASEQKYLSVEFSKNVEERMRACRNN